MSVRRPSWDNQFYPGDRDEARAMCEDFFSASEHPAIGGTIRAIQVPHAGWVFSGKAAAEAYKQIQGRDYSTVVMIGPQHRVPARHLQVYPQGVWQSPLGNLEVDADLAARFIAFDDLFQPDAKAHQPEHSLEVQVPMLASVLPEVKILPILTAAFVSDQIGVLARALREIIGKDDKTLILISTDLYHGESYQACRKSDAETIGYVKGLDGKGLGQALAAGTASACGGDGLTALLNASNDLGIVQAELLAAYNSNDATGQQGGYVVGYSAFAFTGGI